MSAADSGHAFFSRPSILGGDDAACAFKICAVLGFEEDGSNVFLRPSMPGVTLRPCRCHDRRRYANSRMPFQGLGIRQASLSAAISDKPPIAADRMAAIRALFDEHEEISASMVVGALGLSVRRVREILQQLTDAGVLMKQSDRRSARYMLTPRQKRQSD